MRTKYFLVALLMLVVSINASRAQTYNLKSLTSEQFASGGTDEWSFEQHDITAGTYATFTTYGDASTAVNYYDQFLTERFCLFPIMNRPASGTQYETKRNAWYSNADEYLYVAHEYENGATVGDLIYGVNYPDSLYGYEVYSISSGKNSAITFTVPADGYYRADMKVVRQDLWSAIGEMKVYQFFRYGGEGTGYSMGKEFVYGKSQGIDTWAAGNEALYAEYLAKIPESPSVNGNSGKPYRGLPTGPASNYIYFYAKAGDKISFEADARSTGNIETTPRGAYARTKWLNLVISATDQTTASADSRFANPYENDPVLLDSLYTVLDLAEYVLNEEGPANGYSQTYLSQLETLFVYIDGVVADGAMRSMEIPALIDQLWAAIELARTPVLPVPESGNYYVIKNYTTGTYLGGNGSGNDAVKHENATTNAYYHIFLLTGDNDNGYTFQQVASGNYVTHNNQWTGSYAGATGSNRQLFRFDTSNPNYFVIQRKKDDGSFAVGIGFDTQTSGSTCYFDKGADKWNTWLFDADGAKAILTEQLDVAVAEAQELYDKNPEIDGAASVLSAIATANAAKNNASATAADVIAAINPLKSAMQNLLTADKLRLAIADAQALYATNSSIDGAAAFQTAIDAAIAAYNASKSAFDANALTQGVTDLAAAKAAFLLKIAEATGTVENPVEVTSQIVNPGFDANNANGWTIASAGAASQSEYELYNKPSFDFYQTITGLPVGQYKVTVQGFHRVGANSIAAVDAHKNGTEAIPVALYANDNISPLLSVYSDSITGTGWRYISTPDTLDFVNSVGDGRAAFDAGKYAGNTVYTFVSDGTLRLGLKTTAATQSSNWTLFDNFQLFYCGKDVSVAPYIAELQAAYDDAKAYYDAILTEEVAAQSEGDVLGKYAYEDYTALSNALTAAKAILDADPATLIAEQIGAVKTALLAAKANCVKETGLNTLANGEYYILVNDQYYVTNPGNFDTAANKESVISVALGSLSETKNTTDNSQIIKITKQANGRYLFFSALYEEGVSNMGPDGANYRNINENAGFRTDYTGDGELAWRTMNLISDGTHYAVQNAENSAAKGYWGYDATNQRLAVSQSSAQYVFKFISKDGDAISPVAKSDVKIFGANRFISVSTTEPSKVIVYSATGMKVSETLVSGEQFIPVPSGMYIVKVAGKTSAVSKVIVK